MLNYSNNNTKNQQKKSVFKVKLLLNDLANKKGFLLAFRIWGAGTEIFDTFLPLPNLFKRLNDNSYIVAWLIEGYFLTKQNQSFLKDVIERFIAQLNKEVFRIEWIGWINFTKINDNDILHLNAYNLKDDISRYLDYRQNKQNDYKALELFASCTEYKESDDAFFDWLRFKVYDFIKENGKNALTLDYVRELAVIGYEIMGHKKGLSTPLAKAKAIYNWVIENYNPKGSNWNYQRKLTDEELEMTRRERALANNKKRYNEAHKKIISLVTGMFAGEYKKKDGSFNINKIAKDTGYSRNTIYKHLKDEGLI